MDLEAAPSARSRLRLEYLDGVRGLTALYVVLSHIHISLSFFDPNVKLAVALAQAMTRWHCPRSAVAAAVGAVNHGFGMPSVQIFIVLSGYCLMLPVVRNGGSLGSFSAYVRRRANRILPAYFAMLAVGLGIAWIIAAAALLKPPVDELQWGSVVSHILLIHNWSESWYHGIDPPMWSVAVEWQIYFIFPLLLVVWRRLGIFFTLALAFAIAVVPHFLLDGYLDWSRPWFLGLFAFGMAAADFNVSSNDGVRFLHERLPWGWISLALCFCFVWLRTLDGAQNRHFQLITDSVVGLLGMSALVFCTRTVIRRPSPMQQPVALRLLGSRWLSNLGDFSYSLYLVHYPLMLLFFFSTLPIQMPVLARALLMFGLFLPLALAFAYVFHLAFERPFLHRRFTARQD